MFPRRCSVFVLSTFFCCAITAQGGDWGTIRGKVVWAEDKLPKKQRIKLRSPEECACRGEVLDEPYVVDLVLGGITAASGIPIQPPGCGAGPIRVDNQEPLAVRDVIEPALTCKNLRIPHGTMEA